MSVLNPPPISKRQANDLFDSRIDTFVKSGNILELFDLYVDPYDGSDSLAGTSMKTATKSFALINSMAAAGTLPSGVRIGIRAGTKIFDQLNLTLPGNGAMLNDVYIGAYGPGAKPILDCRDQITNWTKTPGYTYLYQAPITLPGDTKILGNLWMGNDMVKQVADIAACEAEAGTFYVGKENWKLTSTTLYVHPPSNLAPEIASNLWRYSKRANGIFVKGHRPRIRNISAIGSASQNGSIVVEGNFASIDDCEMRGGSRHAAFANGGVVYRRCYFGMGRNDLEDPYTANTVVCFDQNPSTAWWRTEDCTHDGTGSDRTTGPLCHGPVTTDLLASQTHLRDTFINLYGIGTANSVNSLFQECNFVNCAGGITHNTGAGLTVRECSGSGTSNIVTANLITAPTQLKLINNSPTLTMLGQGSQGAIVSLSTTAPYNVTETNCPWNVLDTVFSNTSNPAYLYLIKVGNVVIENASFPKDFVLTTSLYNIGEAGASTLQLKNCVLPLGSDFKVNNVTYKHISELVTAGIATNCTYKTPTPIATESFTAADNTTLGSLPGWTRVGGTAGQAVVLGNQLAHVNAAQAAAYLRNEILSANHWVSCIVAGLTGADGTTVQPLAARMLDQNNFVAVRWSSATSTYKVVTYINNVFSQQINATVNAAVGDKIYLVLRGKACMLVVNGRGWRNANISADALLNATQGGTAVRNNILTPVFDNFECGNS